MGSCCSRVSDGRTTRSPSRLICGHRPTAWPVERFIAEGSARTDRRSGPPPNHSGGSATSDGTVARPRQAARARTSPLPRPQARFPQSGSHMTGTAPGQPQALLAGRRRRKSGCRARRSSVLPAASSGAKARTSPTDATESARPAEALARGRGTLPRNESITLMAAMSAADPRQDVLLEANAGPDVSSATERKRPARAPRGVLPRSAVRPATSRQVRRLRSPSCRDHPSKQWILPAALRSRLA